jgi:CheY-like chemotaxis protein/nitrogen-specific signal transduction histidine kinase
MRERHERRLRGDEVEPMYSFRVVTQAGEVRSLELSAVKIEWGKREATLIFVVDATARLQAEQTQRQTLQRQTELNDMKSRFISMASHEFRTPLAFILSSAELLKHYGDRMPEPEKTEVINTIEIGVQRMTQMLDRVLLLGKVEAQMLEFQPAELNLQTLCQDLVEDARIQHSEGGCELALEFEASPAVGLFDEKLLRHIFGNLLSNAIKYSPQGGKVLFRVFSSEGRVAFEVSDQGIGVPAEELPHLFEWFHRASNVGEIQGTGLGWPLSKTPSTCTAAASKSPAPWARAPALPSRFEHPRRPGQRLGKSGNAIRWSAAAQPAAWRLRECPPRRQLRSRGLQCERKMARILVIEDEPHIRDNLLRFVRLEGHEGLAAVDGYAGLQLAREQPPDLIFCDVMMPQMNGMEVLAALQADAALKQVPLVFLSASAESERLEEALRLGASGYVTKPFNFAQLQAVLKQYLPK